MTKAPLSFTFYIAAPIEKVWNGFVSRRPTILFHGRGIPTWTSSLAGR